MGYGVLACLAARFSPARGAAREPCGPTITTKIQADPNTTPFRSARATRVVNGGGEAPPPAPPDQGRGEPVFAGFPPRVSPASSRAKGSRGPAADPLEPESGGKTNEKDGGPRDPPARENSCRRKTVFADTLTERGCFI